MRIEYALDKNDFLVHQLFAASKSERINKSRKTLRIRVPIVYFFLGLLLYVFSDLLFGLVFIGIGIAWYFIYPYYLKNRYIRHYEKYIEENYKNRFGKLVTLDFEDEYIVATDYVGESKLLIKEVTEINEINDYIYLKFSTGESLVLPKNRIKNLNELNSILTKITSDLNIKHNVFLDWKWN